MTQNSQTLEQKAKARKMSVNPQTLKMTAATAAGLFAGGGVAYALTPDAEEPVVEPVVDENVTVVEEAPKEVHHHHYHNTTPAPEPESLPEYFVYDHEVITLDNGSQVDVAIGYTENEHDCYILDTDMDGLANTFIEDKNDNGEFDANESIDLQQNDITLSMNHLPNDFSDIELAEEVTVVVPIDQPADGQEVVSIDTVEEEMLPDYTNDADLAVNDDSIMANDITDVNEFMA